MANGIRTQILSFAPGVKLKELGSNPSAAMMKIHSAYKKYKIQVLSVGKHVKFHTHEPQRFI